MKQEISRDVLQHWEDSFKEERVNYFLRNALVKHDLKDVYTDRDLLQSNQMCFPEETKIGDVMAQKQSGRCWMFAVLNVLRSKVIRERKMKPEFRFSVPYLYFYDKLERANYSLERILKEKGMDERGKIDRSLFSCPVGEGGQWYLFVNLAEKYGLVPEECMPETYHSENAQQFWLVINRIVRNDAVQLLHMMDAGKPERELMEKKEEILSSVYKLLCCCLGCPPSEFIYEFKDTEGTYHQLNMTPRQFAEEFCGCGCSHLNEYVYVINMPGKDRPYHKTFTLKNLGNVWGKRGIYYNLSMEEIKPLLLSILEEGETVWFGCDCMNDMDRESGVMTDGLYDYKGLFDVSYEMSKEEMLDYCESSPNHDMVIVAVKEKTPGYHVWKVENSWGVQAGMQGRYLMDDSYLEKYAFQFVIHKKYLSREMLAELGQEPIVLSDKDLMGI
ncbi:MAG: hypothetical protein HFG41_09350 [Coprococcus sp.]|nr:hypothetical protein [Coprococcus sp.]